MIACHWPVFCVICQGSCSNVALMWATNRHSLMVFQKIRCDNPASKKNERGKKLIKKSIFSNIKILQREAQKCAGYRSIN